MRSTWFNGSVRRAALVVGVAGIVVGVVTVVAMFSTEPINSLIAVASFAPFLLLFTVVGLLVCAIFRRWILVALSAGLVGIGASVLAPLYVAGARGDTGDSVPASGLTLRVMQANLFAGDADSADVVGTVRERGIDLLTVQELTTSSVASMEALGLTQLLPYQYLMPDEVGGAGAGIYSRYPLGKTRELSGFGPTNLAASVEFGRGFTVLAVHPGAAYVTPPEMWTSELRTLRDALAIAAAIDDTVVVSGDFNTTRAHKQFRDLLDAGYVDAADQTGSGIVPTFPANARYPAIIGIDHVLARGAEPTSIARIDIDGSDHHGLIVELAVREQ